LGTKVVKQVDEPLLDQLVESVRSNLGKSQTAGSSRSMIPLDVAALQLVEDIDGRVRSWLSDLGATPGRAVTLRGLVSSWLVLFQGRPHEDAYVEDHRRILEGWVAAIVEKLQPRRRLEITSPCPACGVEFVNVGLRLPNGEDDPNDLERVRVLVAVEGESLEESFALCRSCDRVWRGVSAMRSLRIAMDEKAEAS
jgi:hypothetical protein